jgi:two-component system sensor histidine kinase MprB
VTFRSRLTVLAAAAVAVAVALAAVLVYVAAQSVLRGEVDAALRRQAVVFAQAPVEAACVRDVFPELPRPRFGGPEGYVQIVCAGDELVREPGEEAGLPVSERVEAVAVGEEDAFLSDATVDGVHLRVLTVPVRERAALQVARRLDEVDRVLRGLRNVLVLVTLGGIGIAAALGLLVSGSALAPIRRLTEATEHVAETRDLRRRIEVSGRDELSRLAGSFNEMLEALDASLAAQRRLVADASHELRTPLTSLRTNVEVLARPDAPTGEERERLLRDIVDQTAELTRLVEDVVELARGHEPSLAETDVRLDELVAAAVERAGRHAPHVRFRTDLDGSVVRGVPERIDRAVSNLLDNAAKWSPPEGEVDVVVRAGEVTVRDRGPGIADEDLPHVFDRFYRSAAARRLPGSGLGLAIVRQVAEAHGGSVSAEAAEGGGAVLRLRLGAAA